MERAARPGGRESTPPPVGSRPGGGVSRGADSADDGDGYFTSRQLLASSGRKAWAAGTVAMSL